MVDRIQILWIKNKKATINPINKKQNKCFKYSVTVVLNREQIGKYSERITKVKPFIYQYYFMYLNIFYI